MASNPMQRKSRNSFLIGVVITLIIATVPIFFLFRQLQSKTDELNTELNAKQNVYVLNQDVKSGQILTEDMFSTKRIHKDSIPSNATSVASVIDSWFLQTKEGEEIHTDKEGLYLQRDESTADTIVEIWQNDGSNYDTKLKDSDGNRIEKGEKFTCIDGTIEKYISSNSSREVQDDYGAYYISKTDAQTRVFQEDATEKFYIFEIDNSTMNTSTKRVKKYIDINNVPVLAKVSMNKNTVITPNLIVQSDENITDDVRQEDYNMIVLPADLMTDDYVDIRLMTPTGQNFIVISKAKVTIPTNNDGTYITDTVRMNLSEDEILTISSAIVEASGLSGSKLYATKYVEAGMQNAATPTYIPNAAVTAQISADPNIVSAAMETLRARYTDTAKAIRNNYLQSLIDSSDDYENKVKSKQDENTANQITARQKYLESLNQ